MTKLVLLFSLPLVFASCASKPKVDKALLEKYPACYNMNVNITNKCIEKNEAGDKTTALELENTQYPGQYK
jgi:hypothetical protein